MLRFTLSIILGILVIYLVNSLGIVMLGPIRCEDGWNSSSIGIQGACSHHGGVNDDPYTIVGIVSSVTGILSGFFVYSFPYRRKQEEIKEDPICEIHNVAMMKKYGKYGEFWGCPRFPSCRVTKDIEKIKTAMKRIEKTD